MTNALKMCTLTIVVACWCMRMSGWVSGILDRTSVYLGQPENSMAGSRTTAMSPYVLGPDILNLTHWASSTTAILRSLGSGNLLEPVLPAFSCIMIFIYLYLYWYAIYDNMVRLHSPIPKNRCSSAGLLRISCSNPASTTLPGHPHK